MAVTAVLYPVVFGRAAPRPPISRRTNGAAKTRLTSRSDGPRIATEAAAPAVVRKRRRECFFILHLPFSLSDQRAIRMREAGICEHSRSHMTSFGFLLDGRYVLSTSSSSRERSLTDVLLRLTLITSPPTRAIVLLEHRLAPQQKL